jgi:hypothetical protein
MDPDSDYDLLPPRCLSRNRQSSDDAGEGDISGFQSPAPSRASDEEDPRWVVFKPHAEMLKIAADGHYVVPFLLCQYFSEHGAVQAWKTYRTGGFHSLSLLPEWCNEQRMHQIRAFADGVTASRFSYRVAGLSDLVHIPVFDQLAFIAFHRHVKHRQEEVTRMLDEFEAAHADIKQLDELP